MRPFLPRRIRGLKHRRARLCYSSTSLLLLFLQQFRFGYGDGSGFGNCIPISNLLVFVSLFVNRSLVHRFFVFVSALTLLTLPQFYDSYSRPFTNTPVQLNYPTLLFRRLTFLAKMLIFCTYIIKNYISFTTEMILKGLYILFSLLSADTKFM